MVDDVSGAVDFLMRWAGARQREDESPDNRILSHHGVYGRFRLFL
jgi:hypothetical protein